MKFLRILVIATMLNIPCAYAMEEVVTECGKFALEIAGDLLVADACCTAVTGESSALLKLSFGAEIKNPILKGALATTEAVVGIAALSYSLKRLQ